VIKKSLSPLAKTWQPPSPDSKEGIHLHIERKLFKSRAKHQAHKAVSNHPAVNLEDFKAEENEQIKMPKRASREEEILTKFLSTYVLRDPTSLSIEEINEDIENLDKATKAKLLEITPPKKPYVNHRLNNLNLEFKTLVKINRAIMENDYAEAFLLTRQLKFSKKAFPPEEPWPTKRNCKEARAIVGKMIRRVTASDIFRREQAMNRDPNKENLAKLWFKNPKKVYQKMMGSEESPTCEIDGKVLYEYHSKVNQGAKSDSSPYDFNIDPITSLPGVAATRPRACNQEENIGVPFYKEEIENAFKYCNKKSAPGINKLPTRLFFLTPGLIVWVTALFDRLRVLQVCPESWKHGEVQLVYKKDDKMLPQNWRPITLLIALYKLYTSCLNFRLHSHNRLLPNSNAIFSYNQRGFRPNVSGCTDNAALLRRLENHAMNSNGKLYQLYIDFKNAFGSPDHLLIFKILDWFNIPEYIVNFLKSAYDGPTLKIRFGKNKLTPALNVEKGTFQGDPFSPSIFNLAVELLIRFLNCLEKIEVGNVSVNNLAYADDMIAVTGTLETFRLFSKVLEIFNLVTLVEANVTKTVVTCLVRKPDGRRTSVNPKLRYGPDPNFFFPFLKGAETYQYLGTEASGTGNSMPAARRVKKILDKGTAMLHSNTVAWLKTDVIRMFILPKIYYTFANWSFKPCQLEKLDLQQRKLIRMCEGLRNSFCCAGIHAPKELGGLGFPDFKYVANSLYSTAYFRRLFLSDYQVRSVERVTLFEECKRLNKKDPTAPIEELLQRPMYFAATMDNDSPKDLRAAFSPFLDTDTFGDVIFTGNINDVNSFGILPPDEGDHPGLRAQVEEIVNLINKSVNVQVQKTWATTLTLQGSPTLGMYDQVHAPKAAQCPHLREPHKFTASERKFAIYCQTNQINSADNLVRWKLADSANCVRCGEHENCKHVLNGCLSRMPEIKERHDAAHEVLHQHLVKRFPVGPCCENRRDIIPDPFYSGSSLRPDETVIFSNPAKRSNPKLNYALIIDMKTPFPSPDYVKNTHVDLATKYESIRVAYERKLIGGASTFTIQIPSTGPVPMHTFDSLARIGFHRNKITKMIREMTTASIKANYHLSKTLRLPSRS
jgi:hypothetical protein